MSVRIILSGCNCKFGLGRFQLKVITHHLAPLSHTADSISLRLFIGERADIENKTESHACGGESKTAGGGALT